MDWQPTFTHSCTPQTRQWECFSDVSSLLLLAISFPSIFAWPLVAFPWWMVLTGWITQAAHLWRVGNRDTVFSDYLEPEQDFKTWGREVGLHRQDRKFLSWLTAKRQCLFMNQRESCGILNIHYAIHFYTDLIRYMKCSQTHIHITDWGDYEQWGQKAMQCKRNNHIKMTDYFKYNWRN